MNNTENRNGELELNLTDIFLKLLKKWWIIVVSAVVAGLLAFTYFAFIATPTYTSRARVLVGREDDPRDTTTSFTINTLNIATDLTKEFRYLIKEPIVLDPVIKSLELDTSVGALSNAVSVSIPENNVRLLDISVSATTPEAAYKINQELVNQCTLILPTIHDHAKIKIIITTPASLPNSPTSPNVAIYTILGIFLGAVLSAVAILVYDMIINKKKNPTAPEASANATEKEAAEKVTVATPKATTKRTTRTTKKTTIETETKKQNS